MNEIESVIFDEFVADRDINRETHIIKNCIFQLSNTWNLCLVRGYRGQERKLFEQALKVALLNIYNEDYVFDIGKLNMLVCDYPEEEHIKLNSKKYQKFNERAWTEQVDKMIRELKERTKC